jgi:hypothetical protein
LQKEAIDPSVKGRKLFTTAGRQTQKMKPLAGKRDSTLSEATEEIFWASTNIQEEGDKGES